MPGDGEPVEEYSDSSFFRLYDSRLIHRETKDYVPKLIAAATIAKEPSRYGFVVADADEPFAADSVYVADMTGLDTTLHVAEHMHDSYGERFFVSQLMQTLVGEKNFGQKTGKGFYEHGS